MVQIQRTEHGIPHITASTYEGLAFGTAYAYAQDNVCLLANQLVTVRGERSQYFGPTATGLLGLRTLPNAQIDLFIRSHMDDAALELANATLGPAAQAAIHAATWRATTATCRTPVGPGCRPSAGARPG